MIKSLLGEVPVIRNYMVGFPEVVPIVRPSASTATQPMFFHLFNNYVLRLEVHPNISKITAKATNLRLNFDMVCLTNEIFSIKCSVAGGA